MDKTKLSRRSVLQTAVATTALAAPFVRSAVAAGEVGPSGKMVLAWHTNIAPRWLDPLQHDGGATGDNFLNVLQDALIKNFREKLYDHLALAEHFEFAEDAKSAVFQLRPGIKFHNGGTITPEDVKWSYEHYHGGWAKVLHEKTEGVEVAGDHTVRFFFKEPFLDFPRLLGTANVCGAGWVVPAKYYQQVGQDGFVQTPVGAGPYRLAAQQPGTKLEFQAFDDYYRPVHVKNFTIISVPDPATRVAMLEREGSRHHIFRSGRSGGAGTAEPEGHPGPGGLRQLVARISRFSGPEKSVPRQARASSLPACRSCAVARRAGPVVSAVPVAPTPHPADRSDSLRPPAGKSGAAPPSTSPFAITMSPVAGESCHAAPRSELLGHALSRTNSHPLEPYMRLRLAQSTELTIGKR